MGYGGIMHQYHLARETVIVDFVGKKSSCVDPITVKMMSFHELISLLPFCDLTYYQSVLSQKTTNYANNFLGMTVNYKGVHKNILRDNIKTVVTYSARYELASPNFTLNINK